jgi:hypothetical protein
MFPLFVLGVFDWIMNRLFGQVFGVEWDLIMFAIKLVVLLFIVSFVRGHFQAGTIVTILVLILGYIILFQYWMLFGPLMIIYILIVFGFTSILFDLSIVKPWEGGGGGGEEAQASQMRRIRG